LEFPVNIFARFFELVHALSQASGQIWQLLRAEKNKHDKQDDKYVRATEVSKAKCEYIHNYINSTGPMIIPLKQRDFAKEERLEPEPMQVEEAKIASWGASKTTASSLAPRERTL
jgi:hypothetical protein